MPCHSGASVDRLDQVPARLQFLFDYSPARGAGRSGAARRSRGAQRDRGACRRNRKRRDRSSTRTRFAPWPRVSGSKQGRKGKALFHPIRLAFTGEAEGLELDLAVPLIEQGAALTPVRPAFARFVNAANARGRVSARA